MGWWITFLEYLKYIYFHPGLCYRLVSYYIGCIHNIEESDVIISVGWQEPVTLWETMFLKEISKLKVKTCSILSLSASGWIHKPFTSTVALKLLSTGQNQAESCLILSPLLTSSGNNIFKIHHKHPLVLKWMGWDLKVGCKSFPGNMFLLFIFGKV